MKRPSTKTVPKSETADDKPTSVEEKPPTAEPEAPAPAAPAVPGKEDLQSQLSKTESLEQKLALVRVPTWECMKK